MANPLEDLGKAVTGAGSTVTQGLADAENAVLAPIKATIEEAQKLVIIAILSVLGAVAAYLFLKWLLNKYSPQGQLAQSEAEIRKYTLLTPEGREEFGGTVKEMV